MKHETVCDCCRGPVVLHSSDDGTSHYESLHLEFNLREKIEAWEMARSIIRDMDWSQPSCIDKIDFEFMLRIKHLKNLYDVVKK